MKLETNREDLLNALQSVIGVVEKRQTMPVLANIHIQIMDEKVLLTATDLEVELQSHFNPELTENGECIAPARKLFDIVRAMPQESTIKLAQEEGKIIIRSGRSRFTLATMAEQEFPSISEKEWISNLNIPIEEFSWLLEKSHFAMAQQDVRYYLNGLLLEFDNTGIRGVATDGHRLAAVKIDLDNGDIPARQIIVPRKGVLEMLRILSASTGEVSLRIGQNHLEMSTSSRRMITKLVDGKFPDYNKVIPEDAENLIRGNRLELRQALLRASILANEKFRGVRLNISNSQINIEANSPEQDEAEEIVSISFNGDAMEVGFNAIYLREALDALETEEFNLSLKNPNSSALITDTSETQAQFVVMPMRL